MLGQSARLQQIGAGEVDRATWAVGDPSEKRVAVECARKTAPALRRSGADTGPAALTPLQQVLLAQDLVGGHDSAATDRQLSGEDAFWRQRFTDGQVPAADRRAQRSGQAAV